MSIPNKISIIISVYNSEQTLDACLESLVSQTYPHLEIILVDDGSVDGTLALCRAWEQKNPRIRVFHQENGGLSAGRNTGLKYVTGKWIMFVDGDDVLEPDTAKALLSFCDDETDIVGGCCLIREKGRIEGPDHFFPEDRLFTGSGKTALYKQLICPWLGAPCCRCIDFGVVWGKLYRASFLKENSLTFSFDAPYNEDNIFNIRAFYLANAVRYVDQPMYIYDFDHQRSLSKLPDKEGFARGLSRFDAQCRVLNALRLFDDLEIRVTYYRYLFRVFISYQRRFSRLPLRDYLDVTRKTLDSDACRGLFGQPSLRKELGLSAREKILYTAYRRRLYGPVYVFRRVRRPNEKT